MQRLLARTDAYRRQCQSAREALPRLPEVEMAVLQRHQTIYVFGYELLYLYGAQDTIEDILRLAAAGRAVSAAERPKRLRGYPQDSAFWHSALVLTPSQHRR
jgi:hypothetical protein